MLNAASNPLQTSLKHLLIYLILKAIMIPFLAVQVKQSY